MLSPDLRQHDKIEVSEFMLQFRSFLVLNWEFVHKLMELHDFDWNDDPDFTSDWEQANWEFLFQRLLVGPKIFIRYNEITERVISSDAQDSYELVFEDSKGSTYQFRFFNTTKVENDSSFYKISPPFDYVCGILKSEDRPSKSKVFHFPASEVSFFLVRLVEPSAVLGLYPEEQY